MPDDPRHHNHDAQDHAHGMYAVDPTHTHPTQPDLEDAALTHHQIMQMAVTELLIDKGVFTATEMRAKIEMMDNLSPARGAELVAHAWVDNRFKARLIEDSATAAEELGMDIGPIPILVMENTPAVHNVVVCTLCSCYPRFLVGIPPDWYKSREYRSRVVREPRAVLAEFGTTIDEGVEIRVHDSTADMRYLVMPMRPEGTENWSESALAELVTRDAMIGVTRPRGPVRA